MMCAFDVAFVLLGKLGTNAKFPVADLPGFSFTGSLFCEARGVNNLVKRSCIFPAEKKIANGVVFQETRCPPASTVYHFAS